jgi:methionine--tRNA ligase beta chain
MAVLHPLKLVIENFPAGEVREFHAPLHPEDAAQGTRKVPFSRELYIERDDFQENPPKEWFRLAPGREVRLRYACLVRCSQVIKDAAGEIVEVRCTWDPASWGGGAPDGRVVRGTLHWVSAAHAVPSEVRLYDRLFSVESPGSDEGRSFLEEINPTSEVRLASCRLEPYLAGASPGARFQFERLGYFCVDRESAAGRLIFNRTVTLRDTWAKIVAKAEAQPARAQPSKKPQGDAKPGASKPKAPAAAPAPPPEIAIEDFAKLDLRVGVVREAAAVEAADKLIRLTVDLGEGRLRQIFAGLRAYYPDPAVLVGKRVIVVANLKPRQMKFGLSEGMILAAGGPAGSARPHRIASFEAGDDAPEPGDKIA